MKIKYIINKTHISLNSASNNIISTTVKKTEDYEGMGNLVYNSLGACYGSYRASGDRYYKIHIPNTEDVFTMLNIEISIRFYGNPMQGGKLFLDLIHGVNENFVQERSNCTVIGNIGRDLKIFTDGDSDIYIYNRTNYSTISVNKILTGDTVRSINIKDISITEVETLPDTAVEVPVNFAVTERSSADIVGDLRIGQSWGVKCIYVLGEATESHESIMKKSWGSIFTSYSGMVFLTTSSGNLAFWMCWGYSNARYGFAMCMGYDRTPRFYQIVGGIWKDPENL